MAKTQGTKLLITDAMNNAEVLTYTLESFNSSAGKNKRNYTLDIYKFKPEDYITVSLTENKWPVYRIVNANDNGTQNIGLLICINAEDSEKRAFGYNSPNNYIEFARVRNIIIIGFISNIYIPKYSTNAYAPFSKQCFDYIHNAFKEFDYYYFYSKTADAFGFLDFNAGTIKYESKVHEVVRQPDITKLTNVSTSSSLTKYCSYGSYTGASYYNGNIFVDPTKINNLLIDSCKHIKCRDLFSMIVKDDNNKLVYLTNPEGTQPLHVKYMGYNRGYNSTFYDNNDVHIYKTTIDGVYVLTYRALKDTYAFANSFFMNRNNANYQKFAVLNRDSSAIMATPNNAFNDWFINKVVPDLYYSPAIYETGEYNNCLKISCNFTTVYDIGVIIQHYINDFLNGSIECAKVYSKDLENSEEVLYLLGMDED